LSPKEASRNLPHDSIPLKKHAIARVLACYECDDFVHITLQNE